MTLHDFFKIHNRVAVAISGGIDSAYLLHMARECGASVHGYFVKSEFVPKFEEADVVSLSEKLNVPITKIEISLLSCSDITKNDGERCYFCKKRIFEAVCKKAGEDGFKTVLEGTNASDDVNDRPGFRAISEMGVLSPLRMCGITKAELRHLSKEAGLFLWDKPSYSCLATRVERNTEICPDKLCKIEKCEGFLFLLGFSDFRIRLDGNDGARLELNIKDKSLFLQNRTGIVAELEKHFSSVTFDLEARR